MRKSGSLVAVAMTVTLLACGPKAAPQTEPTRAPTAAPEASSAPPLTPAIVAEVIFTNANIITMDDASPSAQALAVREDTILAVGGNAEVAQYRGVDTVLVDLGGLTIVPGFIDAHQHRIGDRWRLDIDNPEDVIQPAIEQGWTALGELYVDQGRLNELIDLDRAGVLRLRVNAYLPVMANSPEGIMFDDYYTTYAPGEMVSPNVRIAGLKIFTDFDNATILLWQQDALNAFVLARVREGWPLAIKTVSTRSLEMILKAVEYVKTFVPDVVNRRVRLEHMLFATPEQIARIKDLGMVPVINLNAPGQMVGDADIDQLIAREPQGSYTPWRSLEQAGILVANTTGWPSYYVDEPTGAPFGSPMHLIFQAVTRVGNLGQKPYPWLLDQTITAEQAMRALTIDGAYASFEEGAKGSLAPGKLADLVILSANPLRLSAEQVNNIDVLMTMVGGKVEWCAPGYEQLCPGGVPAPAEASDPFVGDWSAKDPEDGSNMTLHIARYDGMYDVVLVDEQATTCGLDAAGIPNIAAEVAATGTKHENVLSTSVTTLKCLSESPTSRVLSLTIDYTYQSDTDTLIDSSQGAVWHRQ
jgi:hypothetical protein